MRGSPCVPNLPFRGRRATARPRQHSVCAQQSTEIKIGPRGTFVRGRLTQQGNECQRFSDPGRARATLLWHMAVRAKLRANKINIFSTTQHSSAQVKNLVGEHQARILLSVPSQWSRRRLGPAVRLSSSWQPPLFDCWGDCYASARTSVTAITFWSFLSEAPPGPASQPDRGPAKVGHSPICKCRSGPLRLLQSQARLL